VTALVIALILLAVAGIALVLARAAARSDDSDASDMAPFIKWAGVALALVSGVVVVADSYVIVPTRTVGVEVSFGKPVGVLSNGWHWVAPWHTVENFDASVQTLNLTAAKDDAGDPVTVRLANQTTAQVDVSVQFNIDPNGDVVDLYKRYRSFDNVENNLIKRQLQHALNLVFAAYDPLRAINGAADTSGPNVDDLAAKAKTDLQAAVGTGIQIGTLTIPIVHFDGPTEDRLRAYQQALADTRIAEQRRKTAEQTKAANDTLASSTASSNPGVQYQNCLDLIRDLAGKGQLDKLPPTFNCGSGTGTPVIVGK
jgi:regulator of protease activity HflC (stomatin/prohibitin superfamily)